VAYRAAVALVDLAVRKKVDLTVGECLAVLLQSWNRAYYQYHGGFDSRHFDQIEQLLANHSATLALYKKRSIQRFSPADEPAVRQMFKSFELVLGPVGAAKALHLLAPRFFALWDNAISVKYRVRLQARGWNADRYCRFMVITSKQVKSLGGEQAIGRNPLKALDEYNYCKAKGWK
jgi:hypothetical protein